MRDPEMQAANVKATARAFNVPLRHLRRAISAGELTTYCSGGKRAVLLFDSVREWLRSRPSQPRSNSYE